MHTTPKIEYRTGQHYVAIRKNVNMKDIPAVLPPLIPEVVDWLNKNKISADGIPFFHYLSMDKNNDMEVAVGVLVPGSVNGDEQVAGGFFPAGKYAAITYFGDYNNIKEGHMALQAWLKENSPKEKPISAMNTKWGGPTEFYITDPRRETNPKKWQTDIVTLLDDSIQAVRNPA